MNIVPLLIEFRAVQKQEHFGEKRRRWKRQQHIDDYV